MPRISNIEKLSRKEINILSISKNVKFAEMSEFIAQSFNTISEYLGKHSLLPADVPFLIYKNMETESVTVQACIPIPVIIEGNNIINFDIIPAEKTVFCMYQGDNSKIEQIYQEMQKYIEDNGMKPKGELYETYYNDISYSVEMLLVKVEIPVE